MSSPTMKMVVEAISAPHDAATHAPNIVRWESLYACRSETKTLILADGEHKRQRRTLSMAKRVCEDWAGLLWTENAAVEAGDDDSPTMAYTTSMFGPAFAPRFVDHLERTMASGFGGLEVLIDGLLVTDSGEVTSAADATLSVETVMARCIVPLSWRHGRVSEVAFVTFGKKHVDVREHRDTPDGRSITNRHFDLTSDTLVENPAAVIEAGVVPYLNIIGAPRLFACFGPAIANNIAPDSPFGVSVFANATSQLDTVDLVWDNLAEDFELGGKMVFLPDTMLRRDGTRSTEYPHGKPVPPQRDKRNLFVALEGEVGVGGGAASITEHNPDLRVTDNVAGLDAALSALSNSVGMGSERYRYRGETIATATQIISENSDLFRNRRKHMLAMTSALVDIARAVLWCAANLLGEDVDPDAEIVVRSDDSVIEDDGTRQARGLAKVQAGVMSVVRYLIDYEGMTEADAATEAARIAPPAAALF